MGNQKLHFYKMHGTGNDFVVLDLRNSSLNEQQLIDLAPDLCDRRFGVGADGLLALDQPDDPADNYRMIYRNADGSDAGMCGNGARCLARFAVEQCDMPKSLSFTVHDNTYRAEVNGDTVIVHFPVTVTPHSIALKGEEAHIIRADTGTEHIVLPVSEDQLTDRSFLRETGRRLRHHRNLAPRGTNVNFIYGQKTNHLKIQTYERGVEDLTLSCGTGAIASALSQHHLLEESEVESGTQSSNSIIYNVQCTGGMLRVHFTFDPDKKIYNHIKLEGPAHFVFEGYYDFE